MEECKEQIRKVEDQINKASQEISDLYSLEKTDKDRFESKSVQERIKYLTNKEEYLRKKEILLLETSSRTSAPTGNSITLPLSCPFLPSPFPPDFPQNNSLRRSLQLNYKIGGVEGLMRVCVSELFDNDVGIVLL